MSNTVELPCAHCGRQFLKDKKEHTRRIKAGKTVFYCGVPCFNKETKADPLTPFRAIRKRHKHSAEQRGKIFELSVEQIKELWDKQGGRCPYTGLEMRLPVSEWDQLGRAANPYQASLDRIDSSRGYVQGNVEFVCLVVNYAKNGFSKQEMLDFFKSIYDTSTKETTVRRLYST